jgi:hypothetical protein
LEVDAVADVDLLLPLRRVRCLRRSRPPANEVLRMLPGERRASPAKDGAEVIAAPTVDDLRCPATHKRDFVDEASAERHLLIALRRHGFEGWQPRNVYRCPRCGWWHLASNRREKLRAAEEATAEAGRPTSPSPATPATEAPRA